MFHVRIEIEGDKKPEYVWDLIDETSLRDRYIVPWQNGGTLVVNGRRLEATNVRRLQVFFSKGGRAALEAQWDQRADEAAANGMLTFKTDGELWLKFADDKTDEFVRTQTIEPQSIPLKSDTAVAMKIFVSYSHKDKRYLDALKPHLIPLIRERNIDLWDDSRIHAGAQWKDEIESALEEAQVGILLISKHFLASDFIDKNELPPLLNSANSRGVIILQIIVSPCMIPESLSQFQMINSPNETITQKNHANREKIYLKVAKEIKHLSQQKAQTHKKGPDGPEK